MLTFGNLHNYRINIRDNANSDMGAFTETLLAFGNETGDEKFGWKFLSTTTVGGKPFQLWTVRDKKDPMYATAYMYFDGPGPIKLPTTPPMMFDANAAKFNGEKCRLSGVSANQARVYFQCNFSC